MPSIQVTNINGEVKEVDYEIGLSLMEVLRDEGYEQILAMCGGCCSCATCHVHIQADSVSELPQIEEDEQLLIELTDNYQSESSRLSCQIEMTEQLHGLAVTIVQTD